MIYLAEHEHGFIKVGRSKNPSSRVSSINSSCPYDVELLTTIESDKDSSVEGTIHTYLGKYRESGEWFRPPTRVVDALSDADRIDFDNVHRFMRDAKRKTEPVGEADRKPLLELVERDPPVPEGF